MSSHEEKEWWLDTYWPVLVITGGILFILATHLFQPAY